MLNNAEKKKSMLKSSVKKPLPVERKADTPEPVIKTVLVKLPYALWEEMRHTALEQKTTGQNLLVDGLKSELKKHRKG